MPAEPSALLYCAGGGLGDSLVASVVARALRAKYARVDALTLPEHRETLEHVRDIDSVLLDEGEDEAALARHLAAREYAAAIVTWATPRTARIAQRARIPIRVGQARRLYSWRFTHRVPVRSEQGDITTHWSQILLDYARAIGCDTSDATPGFAPSAADEDEATALLHELNVEPRAFVVLHPANALAPQRSTWPTGAWSMLAAALRAEFGVQVLVSGGAAERAIAQDVAARSRATAIAGRTSIGSFGALARASRCFIGITTGAMHVAAASGAATLGIFPFQSDVPERWGPLGARTAVVRASYPCRAGERKETCPDFACVANLDVPRILAAAVSLAN